MVLAAGSPKCPPGNLGSGVDLIGHAFCCVWGCLGLVLEMRGLASRAKPRVNASQAKPRGRNIAENNLRGWI